MAYFDKYGVEFSDDRKTLVKCPTELRGVYTIPEGVKEIEDDAFFYCEHMTSISFSNDVEKIGSRAFQYCTSLESVFLSNNLKEIGWCAFMDCRMLKDIKIPENVSRIDEYAFGNCTNLKSIFIPQSVYHIESLSFDNCTNLESINVDSNNRCYCSIDGVLLWKFGAALYLLRCPIKKYGSYIVPEKVRRIELFAFQNCVNLTSITLPMGLSNVLDSAFWGCNNLQKIIVPYGQRSRFAKMEGLAKYAGIIMER